MNAETTPTQAEKLAALRSYEDDQEKIRKREAREESLVNPKRR